MLDGESRAMQGALSQELECREHSAGSWSVGSTQPGVGVQGALSRELEGSRSQLVGVLTRASSPGAELSQQAVTALSGPSEHRACIDPG